MRRAWLLVLALVLLAACQTVPGTIDTGDIIDSQAAVTSGAATVSSGAATVATQADHLAAGLSSAAVANPSLAALAEEGAAHAAASRRHADEAQAHGAAVEKANRAIVNYVRDAEVQVRALAEANVDKERFKGQRNTAWAILVGLGVLVAVAVFLKVKGLFF